MITWDIETIVLEETLKGDWGCFAISGEDKEGNEYNACIQTSISNPEIDNLTDIILTK